MIDLSPDIESLRAAGTIDGPTAARLMARERREIFSVHPELRALSWLGAILVATGAGILLSKNLDRIGPVALAASVAVAAVICYAYAGYRRHHSRTSLVDEYILLLGALLLSADVAYVEGQFHLLDHGWPRHLLLLTFVHAAGAYFFGSRTLLSLSLVALAGWMGIEQRVDTIFDSTTETGIRGMICAAMILLWRGADGRWRADRFFARVFEHFSAHLALIGALTLTVEREARLAGVIATIVIAAVVIRHGFAARSEPFAIYAFVYGVAAVMVFAGTYVEDQIGCGLFAILLVMAIAGLFRLHDVFKRSTAR